MKNKKVITALLLAALMSVSACGKKEKTDKFKKYLSDGEYKEALDYSKEHDVDFDDYTDEIKEQADGVFADYQEGKIKSTEAVAKLKILGNIAGKEGREYIKEIKSKIDDIEDSASSFEDAEYYFSNEYYDDAKTYYEKVKEGTPHYEEAQKKLAECDEKYIEKVIKDADDYVESGWYSSAIDALESAKSKVSDTKKLDDKIAEVKAAERTGKIKEIEDDYDQWGDTDYTIDSINELLEDYPNDAEIEALLDKYADIYADEVIEDAQYWADSNDYDYAAEKVEAALEKIPGNKKLTDYLATLGESAPAKLSDLSLGGKGFSLADKEMEDTKGNTYPEDNTIYSSDGTDKEYTAEYALDKKYTLLKGRVAPALEFNKDASVKVEVICDGKTEATYTIKASDYYSSIDVDVTGVSKLVFKVTPAEGDKLDKTSILISKVTLDKAEEKTEEKKEDGEKPTEAEEKAEAATTTEKAE